MMKTESSILCEGFHDRAFWAAWLLSLGCTDPGAPGNAGGARKDVYDPWGDPVSKGQFAFIAPNGHFIRVVPCRSKTQIRPLAKIRLKQHSSKHVSNLILNFDGHDEPPEQSIEDLVREFDQAAQKLNGRHFSLFNGDVHVCSIPWTGDDGDSYLLPKHHTLERLVCSAILAVHPDRAQHVRHWLDGRPNPPAEDVKDYSWSHMAGWYATRGCEDFFRAVWEDAHLADELRKRLPDPTTHAVLKRMLELSPGGNDAQ